MTLWGSAAPAGAPRNAPAVPSTRQAYHDQRDAQSEDEPAREMETAPAARLDSVELAPPSESCTSGGRDGGDAVAEDDFRGDRSWGQVRVYSGLLRESQGEDQKGRGSA
jgi:hypothetical protein